MSALSRPIRPLDREDLPALKTLIDATGLFPSEMLDGMTVEFFADRAEGAGWLVCEMDGTLEGVAYYAPERMTSGAWNLLLIAVRPANQGTGVGTALVTHVEAGLRLNSGRLLLVETSGLAEYERTRDFYRKRGFGEEARIRDYYQAGEDKVVFRKLLTEAGVR